MNRRRFAAAVGRHVSSSLLVGAAAGMVVGAGGMAIGTARGRARPSYAQQGEDLAVASIFGLLGVGRPTYLDVGAGDPVEGSNTYLFYERGCRGVLVEPNPD